MTHDIAHCDNSLCKHKNKCFRYLAHLDAVKNNLSYLTYIIWNNEDYIKKCEIYKDLNNANK